MFSKIGKQILQNFQELSNNSILFSILDQSLRGNNIKSQASKIYTKCIRTNGPWITINKNFKKRGAEKKYPINAILKESDMKKRPFQIVSNNCWFSVGSNLVQSSRLLQGLGEFKFEENVGSKSNTKL